VWALTGERRWLIYAWNVLHGSCTFEIEPGNLAHVHEINISGNTKTWEEVIRRQLVLYPGDVFASTRLRRSLREVFNLGFFAGPPEESVNQTGEKGDIDLNLKVQEKFAGQFRGAGCNSTV
jgi:outer membrane protein insertion porin family